MGADIDCVSDDGSSALVRAARWGHSDVVSLLLSLGAATSTPDNSGRTALMWAERKGFTDIAEMLREAGTDDERGAAGLLGGASARSSRAVSPVPTPRNGQVGHAGGASSGVRASSHAHASARRGSDEDPSAEELMAIDLADGEGGASHIASPPPISVPLALPMRVEGWMAKQGHIFKTWKNRWFVLDGRNVLYYAKEGSAKPRGAIQMVDGTDVIVEESYPKPYCFTIVTPRKRFVLQAADEDEMAEWLEAIQNNLEVVPYMDDEEVNMLGDDE